MASSAGSKQALPPGTKAIAQKGANWDSLGLLPSVLNVLQNVLHFTSMTPVQSATIPNFLGHKDVAVEAPTGSGKTVAFVVPIVEKLLRLENPLKKNEVGALIISPTRELAHQTAQVVEQFTNSLNEMEENRDKQLALWRLTGGTEEIDDIRHFRKVGGNIIVATPGRLEFIMKRLPDIRMGTLEVLVLDEADRLLDMGFEASINTILAQLPKQRRTGLFSATMTKRVTELVRAGMRNPIKIAVKVENKDSTQITPTSLANFYTPIEAEAKFSFLIHFLKTEALNKKVIVYFATMASVNFFSKICKNLNLIPTDVPLYAMTGETPQARRESIRKKFTTLTAGILFTTDVLARGVDFPDVDWVIQFDPPKTPDDFVHRSGRTARNGKSGQALVFLLPTEVSYVALMDAKAVPLSLWPKTADLSFISLYENEDAMPKKENEDTPAQAPIKNYVLLQKKKAHTHPALVGMVDLANAARDLALQDRDIIEIGVHAFVSFIASYKEHHANFSFRIKELDFGSVARLFGLLQLPRMKEIHRDKKIDFEPTDVDLNTIPYADKVREDARQLRIAKEQAQEQAKIDAAKKWDEEHGKGNSDDDEDGDSEDKDGEGDQENGEEGGDSSDADSDANDDNEMVMDLKKEAALMKKVKSGKMSKQKMKQLLDAEDDALEAEVLASLSRKPAPHTKSGHQHHKGPKHGSQEFRGYNKWNKDGNGGFNEKKRPASNNLIPSMPNKKFKRR